MTRVCFSGGRDSTLAALRLAHSGQRLILVTVTSDHLVGIDSVRRRLLELRGHLPLNTRWIQVAEPEDLKTDTRFYAPSCLPCHHAYTVAAVWVAEKCGAREVAFGYVGYQSSWPEQTPQAVQRLARILSRHGLTLLLPVYDLQTKADAIEELRELKVLPPTRSNRSACGRQPIPNWHRRCLTKSWVAGKQR